MSRHWKAFWRGVGSVFDITGTWMLSGRPEVPERPRRGLEDDAKVIHEDWGLVIPHQCDNPECEGYVPRRVRRDH
jgi:hypothetical protein